MRIRHVLPLAAILAFSGIVQAGDSIGLKFGAERGELYPEETAGAVPQVNWNALSNPKGTVAEVTDSAGKKIPVTLEWSAGNTWGKFVGDESVDVRLLKTYLDGGSGGKPATVKLKGIPYKSFDLYIYFAGKPKIPSKSTYKVNDINHTICVAPAETGLKQATELDGEKPSEEASGTYLIINGLAGDIDLTTVNHGWNGDKSGDFRSPLAAIQIVDTSDK